MRRPVVTMRLDEAAVAALDRLAAQANVSRSAMAERLLVEGLEGEPDVQDVREEARAARTGAMDIKKRLLRVLGKEVDAISKELK